MIWELHSNYQVLETHGLLFQKKQQALSLSKWLKMRRKKQNLKLSSLDKIRILRTISIFMKP